MIYLSILFIISCLVSIYLVNSAEANYKSAVVYGTKEDAMKAKKRLRVLFQTCVCVNSLLLLITIGAMMIPN